MSLNAQIQFLSVPLSVKQGSPFPVNLKVTNLSTEIFQPGLHNLGSMQPQDNAYWGDSRIRFTQPISPNTVSQVDVNVVATKAGSVPFSWRMVKEGVTWFGQQSEVRPIDVQGIPEPPLALRSDPDDLVGKVILNTGPMIASTTVLRTVWVNTSDRRMLIKSGKIWIGFDGGTKGDCHVEITRSDGSLFMIKPTDHYMDGPEGGAKEAKTFDPYFCLEPNEALIIAYVCAPFTLPGVQHYHVIVGLWWLWR